MIMACDFIGLARERDKIFCVDIGIHENLGTLLGIKVSFACCSVYQAKFYKEIFIYIYIIILKSFKQYVLKLIGFC